MPNPMEKVVQHMFKVKKKSLTWEATKFSLLVGCKI